MASRPFKKCSQEVLNALTMLLPLGVALRAGSTQPGDGGDLVAAGIIIHFPFSFFYHFACALRPESHPVDGNRLCKGDLVMIHCAGAIMTFGTSGTPPRAAGRARLPQAAVGGPERCARGDARSPAALSSVVPAAARLSPSTMPLSAAQAPSAGSCSTWPSAPSAASAPSPGARARLRAATTPCARRDAVRALCRG